MLIVASFAVCAVLVYLPVGPFDSSHLPSGGSGDPAQMTWFLGWSLYALHHGLNIFHSNFVDYPTGVDLANNTSVPLLGVLVAPVTAIAGPVAAVNFLFRVALFSSSFAMFARSEEHTSELQSPC